ncbi:TPA: hypothetical protein ENS27_18600 [bacterium]|nr:hypothetical protein [bacterium]
MLRNIVLILIFSLLICSCGAKNYSGSQLSDEERIIVGVLYFDRNSPNEALETYRTGLTDMFISKLQNVPELRVVERTKLDSIMGEFELSEMGAIDPETAQKIGRLLGAQVLFYGSFTSPFGQQLCLDARLVRVETSEVLSAAQSICEISDKKLFDTVDKVSKTIIAKVKTNHKDLVADLYYSKGRTAEENNDKDSALKFYQKALMYSPSHKSSQKGLARLNS